MYSEDERTGRVCNKCERPTARHLLLDNDTRTLHWYCTSCQDKKTTITVVVGTPAPVRRPIAAAADPFQEVLQSESWQEKQRKGEQEYFRQAAEQEERRKKQQEQAELCNWCAQAKHTQYLRRWNGSTAKWESAAALCVTCYEKSQGMGHAL
jgi:hypothetical protein